MPDSEIELLILTGGVYKPESIDQDPEIVLTQWRVYEVKSLNTRHLTGFNMGTYDGRVSSKIVKFDNETNIGVTGSGRVYQLIGESGHNDDAEYVWSTWCGYNGITPEDIIDVTDQYKGVNK